MTAQFDLAILIKTAEAFHQHAYLTDTGLHLPSNDRSAGSEMLSPRESGLCLFAPVSINTRNASLLFSDLRPTEQ
jgi:hypothetical protein